MTLHRRGFEESVVRLKKWQVKAAAIRRAGVCHCAHRCVLLSYVLPYDLTAPGRGAAKALGKQPCGYFCGSCGWSNAGARPLEDKGKLS